MKKNSSNSTHNDFPISNEMRDLIVRYMNACNANDHALSEQLLHQIKQQGEKEHDLKN